MTDTSAFLARISESPRESAPKLVYADWMEGDAPRDEPCQECIDGDVGCSLCEGAGYLYIPSNSLKRQKCPDCNEGILPDKCSHCDGSGRVPTHNARRAALLRILAEPDEDRWRLAYAAVLEREGTRERCKTCKGSKSNRADRCRHCDGDGLATGPPECRPCKHCKGKGAINTDCPTCQGLGETLDALAAQAKFVRVQCELARLNGACHRSPDGGTRYACYDAPERHDSDCPAQQLRLREQQLLIDDWDGPGGYNWRCWAPGLDNFALKLPGANQVTPYIKFHRGLIRTVHCPGESLDRVVQALCWPAWEECGRCGGRGRYLHQPPTLRGTTRVIDSQCPHCSGSGRILRDVRLTDMPVREIVLTSIPEEWQLMVPAEEESDYFWYRIKADYPHRSFAVVLPSGDTIPAAI